MRPHTLVTQQSQHARSLRKAKGTIEGPVAHAMGDYLTQAHLDGLTLYIPRFANTRELLVVLRGGMRALCADARDRERRTSKGVESPLRMSWLSAATGTGDASMTEGSSRDPYL